jgi:glutaredoxin
MAARLTLYWQPGCTSCLRTKEFLLDRGLEFDSINVLEEPAALQSLAARGLRTVPVLLLGGRTCLAQDIDEVATFVGVDLRRERLPIDVLAPKLAALLELAQLHARQIPAERLETRIGERERTWLDLAFHIPMVATAFLDAVDGGELMYEHYERKPVGADRSLVHIETTAHTTRSRLDRWRHTECTAPRVHLSPARTLRTYYGERPLWPVLERTTWHVAQHCRQLEHLLQSTSGRAPTPPLNARLLEGLPLPSAIWDREITAA